MFIPLSCFRKKSYSLFSISNINSQAYIQIDFLGCVVTVLLDNTLGLFQKFLLGALRPPINQIAVFVKLTTLVVETVGDFVANHEANCSVVQISGSVAGEECALENTGWEFCGKEQGQNLA